MSLVKLILFYFILFQMLNHSKALSLLKNMPKIVKLTKPLFKSKGLLMQYQGILQSWNYLQHLIVLLEVGFPAFLSSKDYSEHALLFINSFVQGFGPKAFTITLYFVSDYCYINIIENIVESR